MKARQPYILFWDEVESGQPLNGPTPRRLAGSVRPEKTPAATPPVWIHFGLDGTPRPFQLHCLE